VAAFAGNAGAAMLRNEASMWIAGERFRDFFVAGRAGFSADKVSRVYLPGRTLRFGRCCQGNGAQNKRTQQQR